MPSLRSGALDKQLCSFPFGKDGSGILANCSLCGTEATLFQQAQYTQVFPLNPAPFCMLFAGLDSTNKSSTSLPISDSRFVLSFIFPFTLISGRNCFLSPVPSGYNGSLDTGFSQAMTWLMSWPDRERYSCPQQSLVVSLLLSLISTLLFSRTGGILSHQKSLTHRYP